MEKYPAVTISLINYNGRKFVFPAIESAVNQDYPNLEIILIDNDSTDGTREEIESKMPIWEEKRKRIREKYDIDAVKPQIIYIKNPDNAGFGRPHNQAIRQAKGEFILLLNYDAILSAGYINNVLKPFRDEKVGAVQGKLLRYDFEKKELRKSPEDANLNIIDTTGLRMFKNRRIVCIGQGEPDRGQYEKETEVFGADGAVPVYRAKALEDTKLLILKHNPRHEKYSYEYFDEDFFMYKEDVDLAWRLRLAGWKTIYAPGAVAYHGRGSGDSMAKSYIDIIKERRKINNAAKYLSSRHQRLMQIKDDFPSLLFVNHFFQFVPKEIGAWVYTAIFEGFAWKVLKDLYQDAPIFLEKRKMVMAKKRVGQKEMERWFE